MRSQVNNASEPEPLPMIDALTYISQRSIVVALAIIGALFVTAGSLLAKRSTRDRQPASIPENSRRALSQSLTVLGYVLTMTSIALFIVAGFVSDLGP